MSSSGTWPNLWTRRRHERSNSAPSAPTTNGATIRPGQKPIEARDRVGDVGAEHVEAGVREVQHAHHAEDERQPRAQHEQQQPVAQAVEHRDGEELHRPRECRARGAENERGPSRSRSGPVQERKSLRTRTAASSGSWSACSTRSSGNSTTGAKRHAGVLDAVRVLRVGLLPDADVERLLQLVVGLAHLDVAAELALPLQAFHARRRP